MRTACSILIVIPILLSSSLQAVSADRPLLGRDRIFPQGEILSDVPLQTTTSVRADTFWFGDYTYMNGFYYARAAKNDKDAVKWTFDRGNGPPAAGIPLITGDPLTGDAIPNGAGWFVDDLTENNAAYWRVITSSLNLGNYPPLMGGGPVAPPVLVGSQSLWVGANFEQSTALCWACGAGYGNDWCQRATSPPIAYDGTGTINLTLTYFQDSERCYDGTQIYLQRADGDELRMIPSDTPGCPTEWEAYGGFTGRIGIDSLVTLGTPWLIAPVTWTSADFGPEQVQGGPQEVRFVIEFRSDGGLSDEDCRGDIIWGPFACDNVIVGGTGVTSASYGFETGLEGWTPGVCAGIGDFTDIVYLDPGIYPIQDPCNCKLADNVLEMADYDPAEGHFIHPNGQHILLSGSICNLDAEPGMPSSKIIFLDFDMYGEISQENPVLLRLGWRYYPHLCEVTSTLEWSPVVADSWTYFGLDGECSGYRSFASSNGTVPSTSQMVIPVIEMITFCDVVGPCVEAANFTPLFDNFALGVTEDPNAPYIAFENGTEFQDVGSFPNALFNVRAPGPANIVYDKNMDNDLARDKCGDSLIVAGPLPGVDANNFYEVKMWWRVAKRAPFQSDRSSGVDTAYKTWRDRVADGLAIDRPYRPEFTFGVMDSIQIGVLPQKNRFLSRFSEKDDDFAGETKASDMIPDDVLLPGSRIEYFLTSNYLRSPNDLYYYPDTSGANFFEFEVLPGVRIAYVADCDGSGIDYCAYHPATLYIDVFNGGSQFFIENALRSVLNGYPPCTVEAGCPIPVDRNWDRYDYLDASAIWSAPFARGPIAGSNNGMTLNQILGYRAIVINTGTYGSGAMHDWDFDLFDEWLVSPDCNANVNRQCFVMNGDRVGELLESLGTYGQPFLTNTLAAALFCDAFNGTSADFDCAPVEDAYCVRLLQAGASPPYFPTLIDVDAYGNWCPNMYGFNAYSPATEIGGVGNRTYQAEEGGKSMSYEQIIRYNSDVSANYKTVLDGVSWHHMAARDASESGDQLCPRTNLGIIEATAAEIRAAMRWGFDVADDANLPKLASVKDLAVCEGTWSFAADVGDEAAALRVNRLFQNEPNPFSPRTTIKFSLAQSGPVEIVIYDVNGRQVKKLVDGPMDPGSYSVVWDGTNDMRHRVGSGVYWSQMKAGSFVSNKKLVVLR